MVNAFERRMQECASMCVSKRIQTVNFNEKSGNSKDSMKLMIDLKQDIAKK
jgi:hypothetical protein